MENAADTLILADLYCASQLKQTTLYYTARNFPKFVNTESWKMLAKEHPSLADAVNKDVAKLLSNFI
jgi:hypothetical protein